MNINVSINAGSVYGMPPESTGSMSKGVSGDIPNVAGPQQGTYPALPTSIENLNSGVPASCCLADQTNSSQIGTTANGSTTLGKSTDEIEVADDTTHVTAEKHCRPRKNDDSSKKPNCSATQSGVQKSAENHSCSSNKVPSEPQGPKDSSAKAVDSKPVDGKPAEGTMEQRLTEIVNAFKATMEGFLKQIKDLIAAIKAPSGGVTPSDPSSSNSVGTPTPQVSGQQRQMESFAVRVPKILAKNDSGQINEADIQSAVAAYQLYQKSEAAEQTFIGKREELLAAGVDKTEAVRKALIYTQEKNLISKSEANFVYSLSFQAAQVDDDKKSVSAATEVGGGTIDYAHGIKGAEIHLANVVNGKMGVQSLELYGG